MLHGVTCCIELESVTSDLASRTNVRDMSCKGYVQKLSQDVMRKFTYVLPAVLFHMQLWH